MAVIEQDITQEVRLKLDWNLRQRLEQAAFATGQSLDDFARLALSHAADTILTPPPLEDNPLDKIIGIFQDEPLMDELMERIRADRRLEIEAVSAD